MTTGVPERSGRSKELAAVLELNRARVMAAYARSLDEIGGPIVADPTVRRQVMAHAERMLSDIVESLRAGRIVVDESYKLAIRESAATRATRGVHPRESMLTSGAFFDVALREIVRDIAENEEENEALALAVVALYETMTMRLGEGLVSYSGYLLNKIHAAQVEERNRVARELHDRVGLWLSTAYRQLELFEMDQEKEGGGPLGRAGERLTAAYEAVQEAMQTLRIVTSELRLREPLMSLEKALLTAFEAVPGDGVTIRLSVNGDEGWAPPAIKDESFLIIREAVRNAVAHGNPSLVLVSVNIAPHEMRIFIDDDGHGFDPARGGSSGGVGLSTMRERAELMSGMLNISAAPGRGTHVQLYIPLPGHGDDDRIR